jgi:ClpP class serine protease
MTNLPNILSRATNTPLLLEPGYARTFFGALAARAGIERLYDANGEIHDREKLRIGAESYTPSRGRDRPYTVDRGVAVIPVTGTLVNKYGYMKPYSGMTGYDGILKRAAEAFADPEVKGVLLDNDTPGGEVAGCFDCVRSLRTMQINSGKPLWALAYDMNASAGMALASAANRRLITASGYAGSIGVVMAHGSYARQLEKQGIEVTLIYAGKHKADGNPYQSLPDDVYQTLLSSLEQLRTEFAQLVATHIGISVEQVLATEAQMYRGSDAITAGLADEVVNGNDAARIFADHLSTQGRLLTIGARMTTEQVTPNAATPAPAADAQQKITLADHQAALTNAKAEARTAERERIGAIVNSEAAKGREELAMHLATCTELAPADAEKVLSAAGQTVKPTTTGHKTALDMVMEGQPVKAIGPDAAANEGQDETAQRLDRVATMYNQQHGIKH